MESLYYGSDPSFKGKFDAVPVVTEEQLSDETKSWAQLVYEMCNDKGELLYKSAGADSGFVNAEPVAILLTKGSCLIFVNFKYNNNRRHDTGQLLMCYEFSRGLKMPKNVYPIYSTFLFNKAAKKISPQAISTLTQLAKHSFGLP